MLFPQVHSVFGQNVRPFCQDYGNNQMCLWQRFKDSKHKGLWAIPSLQTSAGHDQNKDACCHIGGEKPQQNWGTDLAHVGAIFMSRMVSNGKNLAKFSQHFSSSTKMMFAPQPPPPQ